MKTFLTIIIVLLIALAINRFVTGIREHDAYYLVLSIIDINIANTIARSRELT